MMDNARLLAAIERHRTRMVELELKRIPARERCDQRALTKINKEMTAACADPFAQSYRHRRRYTLGQPKRSELGTCGQNAGHPWQCKSLFYGLRSNGLVILLITDPSTGTWVINSWEAQ
jgi:hypothetical protein